MLAEIRDKAQITIPTQILKEAGLKKGEKVDFRVRDGVIEMVPVVVTPKKDMEELLAIVAETRADYKAGRLKAYDTVDEGLRDILGDDYVENNLL